LKALELHEKPDIGALLGTQKSAAVGGYEVKNLALVVSLPTPMRATSLERALPLVRMRTVYGTGSSLKNAALSRWEF